MTERLFVYGTLMKGEPNHHELSAAVHLGPAVTTKGFELVLMGVYPALVRGGVGVVLGELYRIDRSLLAVLDRFEGHPTLYRRRRIVLKGGSTTHAYLLSRARAQRLRPLGCPGWREYQATRAMTTNE